MSNTSFITIHYAIEIIDINERLITLKYVQILFPLNEYSVDNVVSEFFFSITLYHYVSG